MAAILGVAAGALVATTAAATASPSAWIPPPQGLQMPSGQTVTPRGGYEALDAFPTGVTVSPDGRTVVSLAGGPATTSTDPVATYAIEVTDAATGALKQVIHVADAFQTVTYAPDGRTLYAAGGGQGVVDVFTVDAAGMLNGPSALTVPGCSFVSGFALAPGARAMWVACPSDGRVVSQSLPAGTPLASVVVPHPDQVAVAPDGHTVYATDWKGDTVAAIDTASHAVSEIRVGAAPEGIAVLPDGRVVVADSNDATIATIMPATDRVEFSSVGIVGRATDSPSAIAVSPNGRIYVTLAQDNSVAVLSSGSDPGRWRIDGLIPVAWYPTAVALSADGGQLYVVCAEGLGHSASATAPYARADPAALAADGAYLTVGTLERIANPDPATLARDTRLVKRGATVWKPAEPSPLTQGPAGPIKHIIYITRENKLYDTDLGDLRPGPGAPLAVFGRTVTPNLHELASQFVDATQFYYPAFRSTLGHMWEDAGGPSDVYAREATENYLNASWSDPTNYPAAGLLARQALDAGLSVRTYNEETAQQSGLVPSQYQAPTSVFPNYDLSYPDSDREQGWESEFRQFVSHDCTGQLAATYSSDCQLPALEYVYLGGDHTTVVDEPGYPTVEAQVADNDYATAKIVDAVSHSPYWSSTLIVITEDDPQGTGDHESQYRGLVALASPWVKRGYSTNVHYQWTSIVAAIDRLLGLHPISDLAAQARPLDDAFTNTPDLTPFGADPSGTQVYPFTPLPGAPVSIPAP